MLHETPYKLHSFQGHCFSSTSCLVISIAESNLIIFETHYTVVANCHTMCVVAQITDQIIGWSKRSFFINNPLLSVAFCFYGQKIGCIIRIFDLLPVYWFLFWQSHKNDESWWQGNWKRVRHIPGDQTGMACNDRFVILSDSRWDNISKF